MKTFPSNEPPKCEYLGIIIKFFLQRTKYTVYFLNKSMLKNIILSNIVFGSIKICLFLICNSQNIEYNKNNCVEGLKFLEM